MEYPEKDLTEKIIGAAIAVHKYWVGLLINFNKPTLIDGVKRFVL